jgi:predicted Zn-dependent protease
MSLKIKNHLSLGIVAMLAGLSLGHGAHAAAGPHILRVPGQMPASRTDEASLWTIMDGAEQVAKASPDRIKDPALTGYVQSLTCRLAPEYCKELRVYVLQRPAFNASAAANGYIELWSGLLLRADSEDELGFVLGHEITHYAENHAIETQRAAKLRSNVKFALSLAVNWTGQAVAANAGSVRFRPLMTVSIPPRLLRSYCIWAILPPICSIPGSMRPRLIRPASSAPDLRALTQGRRLEYGAN